MQKARAAYEAKWATFAAAGAGGPPIGFNDVPWPQTDARSLGLDKRFASLDECKKSFRKVSLRWHPDRFVQAFGARLVEAEREAVLRKVTQISQAINVLYSK